jgi:hypothetical protein
MTSHNEHIYKVSHLYELLNVFAESLLEKQLRTLQTLKWFLASVIS